jgi:hypothetical protein
MLKDMLNIAELLTRTVGRVSRAAGQSEEEEIPGQPEVFCCTFMDLGEIVLTVQRSVRVERT